MEEKIHSSITSLLADVAIPTETREPQAENTQQQSTEEPKTKPTAETKPEEPLTDEMIESGADLTIGLYDFTQTSIFRWLVTRRKNKKIIKLYGEEALDKLERLINEQDAQNDKKAKVTYLREFTTEELQLLSFARKAEEVLDGLPMTEAEKDLIKIPLMQIMKTRGGTLPPEYALLLGIIQISGARTAEMLMM